MSPPRACDDYLGLSECPTGVDGHVRVTNAFNLLEPFDILDRWEMQCAIDCLDGDTDPEWWPQETDANGLFTLSDVRIEGGVIEFVRLKNPVGPPEWIRHQVALDDGPLYLPFAAEGQVIVRGNGTTITMVSGSPVQPVQELPILTRARPPNINGCDVMTMQEEARNWSIQDLRFESQVGLGGAPKLVGMSFVGISGLRVRNCNFASQLDIGLQLLACPSAKVQSCEYTHLACSDIRVGSRTSCPFGSDCFQTEPCWLPCDGTTSSRIRGSLATGPERRSDSVSILATHHYGPSPTEARSILVDHSDAASLRGVSQEGGRPLNFVHRIGSAQDPRETCWVRNTRFEFRDSVVDSALVRASANGLVVIDGTENTGPATLLLESDGNFETAFACRAADLPGAKFRHSAGPHEGHYSFQACSHSLAVENRWVDATGSPTTPPPNVVVEDVRERVLPPRATPTPLHGEVWIAPAPDGSGDDAIWWCCAPHPTQPSVRIPVWSKGP